MLLMLVNQFEKTDSDMKIEEIAKKDLTMINILLRIISINVQAQYLMKD